ncbi:hypothetical protein GTZ99_07225 [Novosphingobium sp. FSY-8]|uniref:Uncharacterized protein n=1 Tax=Novosphingobium ovatum TaxID=1908523 RepID=A0ABW9XCV5_9SPHN|nr:hypothetical protein [Novosphingobium ovatum]NBC36348.1 hypothetical protein [Novosphingobium ovatum]
MDDNDNKITNLEEFMRRRKAAEKAKRPAIWRARPDTSGQSDARPAKPARNWGQLGYALLVLVGCALLAARCSH